MDPVSRAPAAAGDGRASAGSPPAPPSLEPREQSMIANFCDEIDAIDSEHAASDAAFREEIRARPPAPRTRVQPPERAIIWKVMRGIFTGPVVAMLAGGALVRCERTAVVALPDDLGSTFHVKLIAAVHVASPPAWDGPLDIEVPPGQIVFMAADQGERASSVSGRAAA